MTPARLHLCLSKYELSRELRCSVTTVRSPGSPRFHTSAMNLYQRAPCFDCHKQEARLSLNYVIVLLVSCSNPRVSQYI